MSAKPTGLQSNISRLDRTYRKFTGCIFKRRFDFDTLILPPCKFMTSLNNYNARDVMDGRILHNRFCSYSNRNWNKSEKPSQKHEDDSFSIIWICLGSDGHCHPMSRRISVKSNQWRIGISSRCCIETIISILIIIHALFSCLNFLWQFQDEIETVSSDCELVSFFTQCKKLLQ